MARPQRLVFGETLVELGAEDDRIVVLDADVSSSTQTKLFAAAYPERFFNVGVAEANMVSVAAGLAACGYVPFVSTFAFLLALRAGDQVRAQVAYGRLNVKLMGGYAGLSDFADGASHQSVEDVAVMRSMPNMTVVVPSDVTETKMAVRAAAALDGPVYVRLSRAEVTEDYGPDHPFEIGRGVVLRDGDDTSIIATGPMVRVAMEAADILAAEGVRARVIDMHTVKPIDRDLVIARGTADGRARDAGGAQRLRRPGQRRLRGRLRTLPGARLPVRNSGPVRRVGRLPRDTPTRRPAQRACGRDGPHGRCGQDLVRTLMHPLYDIVRQDLQTDVAQMAEEGHDEAALLKEVEAAVATGSVDALLRLQEDLWTRPSPAGFPYEEPSDWESMSATFPDPESHARFGGTDEELADRLLGGWLGRCAGCQLGKPLEGVTWPESIEETLKVVGSWPLTDYMEPAPTDVELPDNRFFNEPWRSDLARGRFDHVAPDDDILYAMVSQRVLEDHGPDFTPEQSLRNSSTWWPSRRSSPPGAACTAPGIFGLTPPHTARLRQPVPPVAGRADTVRPVGLGRPANPGLAARMAYKDAANSQVRNGIYSGIFFSVLLADMLAHGDPARAVETAAAYVPPRSRFAEMLRSSVTIARGGSLAEG